MIRFSCKCGRFIEAPVELAGGTVQCDNCGLLCDIPLLSDFGHIEDDGTFKLEPSPLADEPHRLAELHRAFSPHRQDEQGRDIDLRTQYDDMIEEAEVIPLTDEDGIPAPKYDPVTGELIEVMKLQNEDVPQAVIPLQSQPVSGTPTLGYASASVHGHSSEGALSGIFKPANIAVIIIIYFVHLMSLAMWIPMGGGFFFIGIGLFALYTLIPAHWSNVVEEIGLWDKDELPTPLRGLLWWDDVFRPALLFGGAILVCHIIPGQIAFRIGAPPPIYIALFLAGGLVFPGLLLTLSTSGAIDNARPDRLFGMIGVCGTRYLAIVVLWIVTYALYLVSYVGAAQYCASIWQLPILFATATPSRPLIAQSPLSQYPAIAMGLLALAVFLMHLFCWQLALLYRSYHERFPWILQRHISQRKLTPLVRSRRRYTTDKPNANAKAPPPVSAIRGVTAAKPVQGSVPVPSTDSLPLDPLPVEPIVPPRR